MMEAMGPWYDLPIELVERISKFVNSHIDILRIRAVCSSWRSAFSPNFKTPKSQFPFKLPSTSHCYLIECTVYVFQLPHPPHTGWLVKILKTLDGTFMILNPLTKRGIKFVFDDKRLNLLDFRVSQVCKSYHVKLLFKGDEKWTTLKDLTRNTDVKTELQGSGPSRNNSMEIKIYRLDEEQHQWIRVHTLGDRIFFAGDDCCFSVSSSDFGDQCRGNCIYYKNGDIIVDISGNDLSEEVILRYKGLHDQHTGIITLQDGKLGSLSSFLEYADIFWPPPSWLFTDDDQAASKKFSPQMLCFLFDTRHVSSCQDKKLDTRHVRSF
ncbi:hypothetical protein H5410_055405 [Solanum commersonii]|uniref:F-box domain-containing protein n=1 Tax=Solanum commersonii TaxID=4109 RepID=A0A9J5WJ06_SOLCO|nr:hypothetical protein H5410_055405 [Solanum commersonii]